MALAVGSPNQNDLSRSNERMPLLGSEGCPIMAYPLPHAVGIALKCHCGPPSQIGVSHCGKCHGLLPTM